MKRFDKLEPEHGPAPKTSTPELGRFEEQPVERAHAEGWDPAKSEGLSPASLERFTGDGTTAARVATDELARLPTLECAACHAEVGKYEQRCPRCQAPMDSPESRALNQQRAVDRRLELEAAARAAEEQAARQRAELAAEAEQRRETLKQVARELRDHYDGRAQSAVFARILLGVILLGGSFLVPSSGLAVALGLVAVGLLVSSLPRDARAWLWDLVTRHRPRP